MPYRGAAADGPERARTGSRRAVSLRQAGHLDGAQSPLSSLLTMTEYPGTSPEGSVSPALP